jgi:O-antigen chain-terminating methyltransferase
VGKKKNSSNEINVQSIMEKIQATIQKRKDEHQALSGYNNADYEIKEDIEFLKANWDTENKGYRIFSHRKLTGPFLVKGREIVHGEIRRYVDPVFWRQREFNASTSRVLDQLLIEISEIKKQLAYSNKSNKK